MERNIYRINDYSLMRIFDTTLTNEFTIETFDTTKQYIERPSDSISLDNIWNNTVWFAGEFRTRINKVYTGNPLIPYSESKPFETVNVQQVDVMLQQGYSFMNVFGLLVNIIDINTNKVYMSRMLRESDFKITSDKELIDGSFWLQACTLFIPKVSKTLSVQITEVTYADISGDGSNIGMIYNFPTDFIPLVSEKPIPDYIISSLKLDNNFYLEVKISTTENKTVEQSILDYFELEIADITVEHVINYGNDTDGYKTIRISNEDDKYLPIKIGLDLSPWSKEGEYTDDNLNIQVTTEINVNGKLMQREAILHTNITDIINPLIADKITHPDTNFPVEIKEEVKIEQKVIQTNKETKIIQVYQPIFVELIADELTIENKNISFEKLTVPAYLVIKKTKKLDEQIIESKRTVDDSIYFDISEVVPVDEDTTYEILDKGNLSIIGRGTVKVNK